MESNFLYMDTVGTKHVLSEYRCRYVYRSSRLYMKCFYLAYDYKCFLWVMQSVADPDFELRGGPSETHPHLSTKQLEVNFCS